MRVRFPIVLLALASLLTVGTLPASSTVEAAGAPALPMYRYTGPSIELHGSLLPGLGSAQRLAPVASSRVLGVAVGLRLRDQAGLQRLLSSLYDRHSPLYHHFLTPQQFKQRFAPTATQLEAVAQWLRSRNLQIVKRFGNGMLITARGTVQSLQSAFGTRLSWYLQGHRQFFANDRLVRVPASLASTIVSVSGLTNGDRLRAAHRVTHAPTRDSGVYMYTPSDVRRLYDLQQFYQMGYSGQGQTIAIYALADYSADNVATFDSKFGLTTSTDRISVSDGVTSGASLDSGQPETELDVEMVHAIAPAAHVLVYEAPNDSDGTLAMWNQIVSDNKAQVVTTSWGRAENLMSKDQLTSQDQVFKEAAAQGQSILDASGDLGAYDAYGDPDQPKFLWKQQVVDFPGSDPWVTAVGGTTLASYGDGSYAGETVWSSTNRTPNAGSGGGLSTFFARPAYQNGPGVDNQYSTGMRQVPDVAANADPDNSPYAVYSVDDTGKAGWMGVGGTSAAAPLWAGYVVLVNQYLSQRSGFLNPTLYALGQKTAGFQFAPFHDITQGTNLYYPATPGWDFATGWGSLDGVALLVDMTLLGH